MKSFARRGFAIAGALVFAACAGGGERPPAAGGEVSQGRVTDVPVVVGPPYTVNGRTYVPADQAHYDEVGRATYYGNELAGRPTANGEAFNPDGISAAHRTLPLPSYAEVTALETGKTILVRINDRGPFSPDKIVDLSIGAARALGIDRAGIAPVRVRRVEPAESDRAALRAGRAAEPRLDASSQLLDALRARIASGSAVIPAATPPPDADDNVREVAIPAFSGAPAASNSEPAPQPASAARPAVSGSYFVQLGAFSSEANARRLADRARRLGEVRLVPGGGVQRVRLGPYPDSAAADRALAEARGAGFSDARVFREN